jgi:hypothetical protein
MQVHGGAEATGHGEQIALDHVVGDAEFIALEPIDFHAAKMLATMGPGYYASLFYRYAALGHGVTPVGARTTGCPPPP